MSLKDRLAEDIAAHGPLTIAQYMTACLHDPRDGYYSIRPSLGEHGDFITAPLVSQMFGELIGLWAVEAWRGLGAPAPFRLVEAGPGDGTLMWDVLRAAKVDPGFLAAAEIWLVEASPPLRALQAERLKPWAHVLHWAGRLDGVPSGAPILLVANELLDCLPARQFVKTAGGWSERVVGLTGGGLAFGLAGGGLQLGYPHAPEGAVLEVSDAQPAFGGEVARRLMEDGGAALLIDYGQAAPGLGDTLQALRRHRKVDPLEAPGEDDLTVHVDFGAVAAAARREGVVAALASQADFLLRLGLEQRAAALARAAPDKAETLARQCERLTAADEMGELFKVLCLFRPDAPRPPAFEAPR